MASIFTIKFALKNNVPLLLAFIKELAINFYEKNVEAKAMDE